MGTTSTYLPTHPWCSVDGGRCFDSSKAESTTYIKDAVSHQNPSHPLHGAVMQMRCPCVSFDDPTQLTQVWLPRSHPSAHAKRLHASSTPLIASPRTRFCALARVACTEESCNVPSGDLAFGSGCARRWDVAFKRIYVGQSECIAAVNVRTNLEHGGVSLMVSNAC